VEIGGELKNEGKSEEVSKKVGMSEGGRLKEGEKKRVCRELNRKDE
jgi:hypothetical protein